jgi:D-alanyl-D-alanine carboxypeptidase
MFTGSLILQLVGQGKISLDDTVEQWLPGEVKGGDQILIRHLLNHTSGIDSDARPGTRHSYANINFSLLGEIAEKATAQPLDVAMRDRLILPLGLGETSFGMIVASDADRPPFLDLGDDVPESSAGGAGGASSSARDIATFLRTLLTGDLIGDGERAAMLQTVSTGGDPLASAATRQPRAGLGIFGFDLECGVAWGYGGETPFNSNQVLAAEDGSRVVVVAQNTGGWSGVNAAALDMFCL